MVQFLEKWTPVQDTRKMQTLLEPNVISADKHISINEDVLRCQAFQAVLQFEATQPERKLKYTKDPTAVYSMIEVERHELKLAPLCTEGVTEDPHALCRACWPPWANGSNLLPAGSGSAPWVLAAHPLWAR